MHPSSEEASHKEVFRHVTDNMLLLACRTSLSSVSRPPKEGLLSEPLLLYVGTTATSTERTWKETAAGSFLADWSRRW